MRKSKNSHANDIRMQTMYFEWNSL